MLMFAIFIALINVVMRFQRGIPLRFSTDPASVFLSAVQSGQ
jgi:hypothetical protein